MLLALVANKGVVGAVVCLLAAALARAVTMVWLYTVNRAKTDNVDAGAYIETSLESTPGL
jgi:hypothetical protein